MFIEPLMIIPSSDHITSWFHPEIDELTKDLIGTPDGYLTGNLMRLDVVFSQDRIMYVVVITDDVGMQEMVVEETLRPYADRLTHLLFEDLWAPGGTDFWKTEYGEIVERMYPMYAEDFAFGVSPNVCIATDGFDWWFKGKSVKNEEQ